MKKQVSPGALLSPVPAVLISCGTMEAPNLLTIAWAGTVCTRPPMVSISIRPERFSYPLIKESGEFVLNLPPAKIVRAVDLCGVRSGKDGGQVRPFRPPPGTGGRGFRPGGGRVPGQLQL